MTQIQSGATWEYWRNIFELVNRSWEPPRDRCLRNRIDFDEFRPYVSILETQLEADSWKIRPKNKAYNFVKMEFLLN